MKTIDYSDESDGNAVKELLVGRQIVSADEKRGLLTLDDGTEVRVVPNQGSCCSSGDYFLENLEAFTNVITNVSVTMEDVDDNTVYKIFVYAEGIALDGFAVATIEGSDGSGYYGTGFELEITPNA